MVTEIQMHNSMKVFRPSETTTETGYKNRFVLLNCMDSLYRLFSSPCCSWYRNLLKFAWKRYESCKNLSLHARSKLDVSTCGFETSVNQKHRQTGYRQLCCFDQVFLTAQFQCANGSGSQSPSESGCRTHSMLATTTEPRLAADLP